MCLWFIIKKILVPFAPVSANHNHACGKKVMKKAKSNDPTMDEAK